MRNSFGRFCFWSFLFLSGVFTGCVLLSLYLHWQEPLEVAIVMTPIKVHLYVESSPGTGIYLDRKIWELKINH